jgi:hypothetical protein
MQEPGNAPLDECMQRHLRRHQLRHPRPALCFPPSTLPFRHGLRPALCSGARNGGLVATSGWISAPKDI